MADIRFDNKGTPTTPPSGKTKIFVDSADKHAKQVDDTGLVTDLTLGTGGGGGGFYGVVFKETDLGGPVFVNDTLIFNSEHFYLTPETSTGKPIVNAIGIPGPTGPTGPPGEAGAGFYGITVAETDGTPSFSGIEKINFNSDSFYVTQNAPNTDEAIVNFRGTVSGGEANLGANVGSGQGDVFRDKTGVTLNFKTLLQGSNITITDNVDDITIASTATGGGGGFYGVLFKDSDVNGFSEKDDTLVFNKDSGFYLTNSPESKPLVNLHDHVVDVLAGSNVSVSESQAGAAKTITVNADVSLNDIPPGFYGIVVEESDGTPSLVDDTIRFLVGDLVVADVNDKPQISLDPSVARLVDVGPGFYGIVVKDDVTTLVTDSIDFQGADFDVSASGDGALVALDASVAKLTDIPPGFYGIIVEESDGTPSLVDDTIRFLVGDLVVTDVNDKPQISLDTSVARLTDITPGFYGIVVKDDVTTLVTDSIDFEGSDFNVAAFEDGAQVSLDASVAKLTDIGPGFYGIIVEESDGNPSLVDDTIRFLVGDLVVADVNDKPQVSLDASVARLDDIPPGFYGITAKHSDDSATFSGLSLLSFESTNFYLTQNDPNTDEVQINFRGSGGVTDHGALTGLSDDDHTQYTLVDGTRAFTGDQSMGSNRLTNVGVPTAGTDAARLTDIGPGFYGIVVEESDGTPSLVDDTIRFLVGDLVVSEVSNKPQISLDASVARLTDITPGFYGIIVKDDVTTVVTDSIEFTGADFDVSASGDGALVALDASVAKLTDIPPGFYGIIVEESDGSPSLKDDTIRFLTGDLVVTDVNDKPQISLDTSVARLTDVGPGFYGIIVKDDVTTVVTDSIEFDGGDFDVAASGDGASVTLDATVARLTDIGPGFYGIIVEESDGTPSLIDDTIRFLTGDLVVADVNDKPQVSLDASVARLDDIPPGFYGLTVRNTTSTAIFSTDTLIFNADEFYLTGADGGIHPTVNIKGVSGAQGPPGDPGDPGPPGPGFYGLTIKEEDTVIGRTDVLSFLGADFDTAADTPQTNDIQVSISSAIARLTDIGPAFYGLVVEESDNTNTFKKERLVFTNTDFDLADDGTGDPQVSLATDVARLSDIGPGFYGIVVKDDVTTLVTDSIDFEGSDFNVAAFEDGAQVTLDASVAKLTDIPPGFYGIIVEESDGSPSLKDDTIRFLTGDLVVTDVNDKPQISLDTSVARLTDITPGFYGVLFKDSDSAGFSERDDTLVFNKDSGFYLTNSPESKPMVNFHDHVEDVVAGSNVSVSTAQTGSAKTITVNADVGLADITPGFYGIVVKDDVTTLVTDSIEFTGADFDVAASGDGALVSIDSSVARLTDIGPGFYGIVVEESDGSNTQPKDDTIQFTTTDFIVGDNSGKPVVSLETNVARLTDIGPGFYGITVAETDGTPSFSGIEKINFNSAAFYVTQNAPNTDESIVNFRGDPNAEANTASNLGVGDGVFAQKTGVDLQFKSLVAGASITLTPTGNDITIASTATGGGGGFYGVLFKDSDVNGFSEKDDTLVFNKDSGFYLTNSPESKPMVNLHDHVVDVVAGTNVSVGVAQTDAARTITVNADVSLEDIGPGFYGIVVKDDVTTVVTDSIEFTGADFDVAASGDGALVSIDASVARLTDITPGFYGIVVEESDGTPSLKDDTIRFLVGDLVVADVNDKPQISLDASVARLVDIGPGFYGIVVKDDVTTVVTDSIDFEGSDFNVAAFEDGAQVTLDASVAKLTDIGPGFYGITAKHSDDTASFSGLDLLSFESQFFYLTQNDPNTDEVQINLRNLPGSSGGETNLGANVGSGQGNVFRDKTGVTLNFKTLLQGANITITDNADDITIAATATGGGGGFYGVLFKDSDVNGFSEKDDTLVFNKDSGFYLTNSPESKPMVNFHDHVETISDSGVGAETLVASDVATNAGHNVTFKRISAGDGISLSSDGNTLTITGGNVPTNPINDSQTGIAISPNSFFYINSAEAPTTRLSSIDIWSSTSWKGELFTVDNGIESARQGLCGGQAMETCEFVPPHPDYITLGATGGADNYRLSITNLNRKLNSDTHVVFHYEDVV